MPEVQVGDRVKITGDFFKEPYADEEPLFGKEGTVTGVHRDVLFAPVTVELDYPPQWLTDSKVGNNVYTEHHELTLLEENTDG